MKHRNQFWVAGLAVLALVLVGCQQTSTKSHATSSSSQTTESSQSSVKKKLSQQQVRLLRLTRPPLR